MAFELPFSAKSPPLIGLDIGSSSVKLVELSEVGGGVMRLERYAIEPLPRGAVVDGNVDKIDVVAEAVKRAWRRAGSRIKNVSMALPASAVITKRIALPGNLREEELEMQVESEANQYIPFALDEVSLDFQVLGPIPNAPDDVEVLIAASRKEKVEDRMAVAQAAGLKPVVVDVESYAMRSALERLIEQLPNGGDGLVIAVFYLGANTTSVTVIHDGEVIYEREQPFGGQQLTGDIARTYGIPAEEAEQKKRSGDLPANYETEVLRPFIDTAVTEITRALQFFFTSTPYTRVDQIMLVGGSAILTGLPEALMERAQVPTSVVSPFKGMEIAAGVREKQLRLDAPALLTPCGLAMRRFDK
ncbi:MAG TPA: pilus assembly protein PilM [Burkholderiaceae bacterium]|nr:pilus assembly protein PilM [Burkholderiaceae bacterium]